MHTYPQGKGDFNSVDGQRDVRTRRVASDTQFSASGGSPPQQDLFEELDRTSYDRRVLVTREENSRALYRIVETSTVPESQIEIDPDDETHTIDSALKDPIPDGRFFERQEGARGGVTYVFRAAWFGRFLDRQCAPADEPPNDTLTYIRPGLDGLLYRYQDGTWLPDAEGWVDRMSRNLLGKFFTTRHAEETKAWLASTQPLQTRPDTRYFNLPNGMLDWKTGELRPHSVELASMIRIPVEWHPNAKAPRFEKFLHEVLPEDCIEFMEEILGYALYPDNRFQKALLLAGPGGNGKGTLLDVARALVGDNNISSQTLHALGEDRFAVATLYGKLANICGDLDARAVERSDIFKMITGRDRITGQHKFKHPFKFLAFCLLMFSANETPPSSDQTDGYFDRWLVVPMERRIRETPREIPNMSDLLTTKEELEGILVLAVKGLQRLMKRDHIEIPASVKAANAAMRDELDSVGTFVRDCCDLGEGPEFWMPKGDWYEGYHRWCIKNNRKPFASNRAIKQLLSNFKSIGGTEKAPARRERARGLSGIRPGPEWPLRAKAYNPDGSVYQPTGDWDVYPPHFGVGKNTKDLAP